MSIECLRALGVGSVFYLSWIGEVYILSRGSQVSYVNFSLFQRMLVENTTFYNNSVYLSLNVTKFDMLIDIGEINTSHDFVLLWKPIMNSLMTKMCVFIKWPGSASIHLLDY